MQFALAEMLHMTLEDMCNSMSSSEYLGWLAYLTVKKENEKKAQNAASIKR